MFINWKKQSKPSQLHVALRRTIVTMSHAEEITEPIKLDEQETSDISELDSELALENVS